MNSAVAPGWRLSSLHMLLNGLVFSIAYPLTNYLAWQAGVQRQLMLSFDAATPFVPWMILPYLSSGLLFVGCYYWVDTTAALRLLSRRMLLCSVLGCLSFALFPLHFALSRPAPETPALAVLYGLLDGVDRPYNQLPSLHVAYCLVYWPALRAPCARLGRLGPALLAGWLLLVAASTVFTYQHHWVDVAAGLALGGLALAALRPGMTQRHVIAFHYAVAAALALLLLGRPSWHGLAGGYLAASLALICLAYLRDDRHFLRKHSGRHPLWIWLLYAPYLAAYRLTWHLVRWRERRRPPFDRWNEWLWVGRRLTCAEAATLPEGCAVIDLANELSETMPLRARRYQHFPLLDLHVPDAQTLRPILEAIGLHARQGRQVYLHCSMGYQRSRLVARLYFETCAT